MFHIKQQGVTNEATGDHRDLDSLAAGLEVGYVWKFWKGLYVAPRVGALYYVVDAATRKSSRANRRSRLRQQPSQELGHVLHPDGERRIFVVNSGDDRESGTEPIVGDRAQVLLDGPHLL